MTTPERQEDWEKEYDEIFGPEHYRICVGRACVCHNTVKSFISHLLSKERAEPHRCPVCYGTGSVGAGFYTNYFMSGESWSHVCPICGDEAIDLYLDSKRPGWSFCADTCFNGHKIEDRDRDPEAMKILKEMS